MRNRKANKVKKHGNALMNGLYGAGAGVYSIPDCERNIPYNRLDRFYLWLFILHSKLSLYYKQKLIRWMIDIH